MQLSRTKALLSTFTRYIQHNQLDTYKFRDMYVRASSIRKTCEETILPHLASVKY